MIEPVFEFSKAIFSWCQSIHPIWLSESESGSVRVCASHFLIHYFHLASSPNSFFRRPSPLSEKSARGTQLLLLLLRAQFSCFCSHILLLLLLTAVSYHNFDSFHPIAFVALSRILKSKWYVIFSCRYVVDIIFRGLIRFCSVDALIDGVVWRHCLALSGAVEGIICRCWRHFGEIDGYTLLPTPFLKLSVHV